MGVSPMLLDFIFFPAVSIPNINIDIVSVVIGALISALLSIAVQAFAPPELRQKALLWVGKAKTYVRPPKVNAEFTKRFRLEEPAKAEDISADFRESLFEFAEERGLSDAQVKRTDTFTQVSLESVSTTKGNISIDINMTETPGGEGVNQIGRGGLSQMQELKVSTVSITVGINGVELEELRGALENCHEFAVSIQGSLGKRTLDSGAYTVDLHVDSPPTVSRFLAKLEADNIYTKSENFEIEFTERNISVTNQGEATISSVFDKIEDILILYA